MSGPWAKIGLGNGRQEVSGSYSANLARLFELARGAEMEEERPEAGQQDLFSR